MQEYRQWITQANTAATVRERQDAFTQLIRMFHPLAFAYALAQVGDRQIAEDVAQESFITAWQELHNLREPATFPIWLKRIVATHCYRANRRRERLAVPLERAHEIADLAPAPHAIAERNELRKMVQCHLMMLSENERVAVTLFYIGGYSYGDLTEFLGVPLSTIKKRLHTARGRLRERMTMMLQDVIQQDKPSGDEVAFRLQFFTAIKAGDIDRLREMLSDQTPLDVATMPDSFGIGGETPLIAAIRADKPDIVSFLIDHGAKPAESDVREAALYNRRAIAQRLITAGGLDTFVGGFASSVAALLKAVYAGDTEAAAGALERRLKAPSATDDQGRTPLMIAAGLGYADIASLLLDRGANLHAVDKKGDDALHHAVNSCNWCYPGHQGVVELLVDRGAPCDIFTAARSGVVSIVKKLVEANPEFVDETTDEGKTPLEIAVGAFTGHAVVDYLRDKPQQMNIWMACQFGNVERVRELLQGDPTLAQAPRVVAGDKTPIHYVAQNWCPQEIAAQIVDILVEHGADVNYREKGSGWRPLHAVAEWWNDTLIADALLRHGAQINPRSDVGWTPLRYAVALGRTEMAQFLRERGGEE